MIHKVLIHKVLDDGNKIDLEINLDDTNQLSDGRLIELANEAWGEMATIHEEDPYGDLPFVMSALQVSNEIYFSSSLKHNSAGFMAEFPDSCASIALERCSAASAQEREDINAQHDGAIHRYGGNCGEPGAVHLFCQRHPELPPGPLPQPARVVAVAMVEQEMKVINPCSSTRKYPNMWGCSKFLNTLGIRAVTNAQASEAIPADWNFYWGTTCL
jgi:hypothetical protein